MRSMIMAQLVPIPDPNMQLVLNEAIPGIVDAGGNMDTAHPGIAGLTELNLYVDWAPADMTGLEYLTGLNSLTMVNTGGDCTIPSFPEGLQDLYMERFEGVVFTTFPSTLVSFSCEDGTSEDLTGYLTVLPSFPLTMRTIDLRAVNSLPVLPTIPDGVEVLTINGASALSALPAGLPASLTQIALSNTGVTSIPAFPGALVSLILSGAPIATIPPFPSTLESLSVGGSPNVTDLPALPASLMSLQVVQMNGLALIPALPVGIEVLEVEDLSSLTALPAFPGSLVNIVLRDLPALSTLPSLPNLSGGLVLEDIPLLAASPAWPDSIGQLTISLAQLDVLAGWPLWTNSISVRWMPLLNDLPALPLGDMVLSLSGLTGLTGLPDLVGRLSGLGIEGSPALQCIPLLPDTMSQVYFWDTGINCLPNRPYFEGPGQGDSMPLCTIYNSSCPDLNPVISGSVYHDANGNGIQDPGEEPLPLATVTLQPLGLTIGLDGNGAFSVGVPIGSYILTVGYPNDYLAGVMPGTHTALLGNPTDEDTGNDFGISFQSNVQDLWVDLIAYHPPVPGFVEPVLIAYANHGTITSDATITLTIDDLTTFIAAQPAPTTISGQTLTWEIAALPMGATGTVEVHLALDAAIALGTIVMHGAVIDPVASDETPADNMVTFNDTVVGSYDPNDKQVLPAQITPAQVASGERLSYTIRFQNTGTYPATRVIITDTLSSDLMWGSFQFTAASHMSTWSLQDGLLEVIFDNINLPDSTNDEPNSHGFLKFSILPDVGLTLGEAVGNRANIYFDFNEPVITNEAVLSIEDAVGVPDEWTDRFQVYPNPVHDILSVGTNGKQIRSLQVFDTTGQLVVQTGGTSLISLVALPSGPYTIRILTETEVQVVPIVKW